jgi:hypothetical protein
MTIDKATKQLTAMRSNLDGRMKYTYDLIKPHSFELKMQDCISGRVRLLNFKIKKASNKAIVVEFICHGFTFNFPLKKNFATMVFDFYNFELLLKYGIKVDENSLNPEMDLEMEF